MLETLRSDFHRLPEVLALGPPDQPDLVAPTPEGAQDDLLGPIPELEPAAPPAPIEPEPAAQLGLF
jgi:hypothetical protein